AMGCSVTDSVAITEPSPVLLTTSATDANCGSANGTATVNVSGGILPYGFLWNTNPKQITATATGLKAGTYEVTVTDSNSCKATSSVIVSELLPIVLSFSYTNENCGKSNGTITVNATGGVGTYTYLWSNGKVSPELTGLTAGTYTVTVTDSNECTKT